ncbi:MAG: phosphatase PAP2 family protein, partial [Leuconostoc falkenbergense]
HLKSNWQRRVASCLLLGLIILIPISRVYVNVHYPSDILAGMAIAYTMLYISQQLFFNNKGVPDDSLK